MIGRLTRGICGLSCSHVAAEEIRYELAELLDSCLRADAINPIIGVHGI